MKEIGQVNYVRMAVTVIVMMTGTVTVIVTAIGTVIVIVIMTVGEIK